MVYLFWEQLVQELVLTALYQVEQILDKSVLVLIGHTRYVVEYIAGIMLDHEFAASVLEMRVGREHIASLDEGVVGCRRVGMCRGSGIV